MGTRRVRTHYDNLKVARDAPPEVVRAAYKVLAQRYHPDRNPGNERAARIMTIVNASYAVLSDPAARAAHDAWIVEQERIEGGESKSFSAGDSEAIRAEPRRHMEEAPSSAAPPSSGAYVGDWIADRVRGVVAAILIAMAVGAVVKLPRMVSRAQQANQLSSSRQFAQPAESRFASFSAEEREKAREECKAELALLLLFMRATINPADERVPEHIRNMYFQAVSTGQSQFNDDVQLAAQMIWAQREDLRAWKRVSVAQKGEICVEKRLYGQPQSLTNWLPIKPASEAGTRP